MTRCPDCGLVLPAAHERDGCRYQRIRTELAAAVGDLTAEDEGMMRWLAGWDRSTVGWVLSVVARAARSS